MKPTATRTTAFLAGIWLGCGGMVYELTREAYPERETLLRALGAVWTVFFFFAPTMLFVVGRQHITRERSYWWRARHRHHREMKEERRRVWADYGNYTLRMLSWFAGGALVVLVAQLIQWIRDSR